ncbi:MAG: DMT family transporter, partial [bacterium]
MKFRFSVGIWFAFLSAFLWSTGGLGIKILPFDGIQVTAFRSLIAALILLPFFRPSKIKWNKTLVGFVISFTWMCTSFVVSTKLTTAANAIALQYTSVFWVFFIDELPVIKRIPKGKIPPLIIVLVGILFYMTEPNTGTNVVGNLLALSSGFAFGLVAITLKRLSLPDGKSAICLANAVNFIVLFIFMRFQLPHLNNAAFELSILIFLGAFQI